MKIAPSVETIMARFPNKDHQIDTITGIPEHLALNIIFEALTKYAASIPTLKGGGIFGHTAMMMSTAQYATIQYILPFVLVPPPGELIFTSGDTAVGLDDTQLLYYKRVYDFEPESNLATQHSRRSSWLNLTNSPTFHSHKHNMSGMQATAYGNSSIIYSQHTVKRRMTW